MCLLISCSFAHAKVWPQTFSTGLFRSVGGNNKATSPDKNKSVASRWEGKVAEVYNRYLVPTTERVAKVVDKYTPAAAKPHVEQAKKFIKKSYIETRDEIAACRDIYASARNNYERLDKVIYIVQTHKRQILYTTGVYLFIRGLRGIGERR